ncbi:PHP domain-containing protein [Gudongella sp. DL1XJH-153]|uniref:PHP domain-containing protein n=1 Tax=Gudongella sp. DL1XJH-153 TaxID=3409804 RepID=UPI003BB6B860
MHTHTTASDGLLTPTELVLKAYQRRLDGIAITDHDSIEGIQEALIESIKIPGFSVIPGVEMGCSHEDEEVHILGYFLDYTNEKLKDTLSTLRNSRWKRGIEILHKLENLGMELPIDEILEKSKKTDFIGRATIARELHDRGFVKSIKEAFDKYLDVNKPAYTERFKLTIEETIKLIHNSGGISVLAHPGLLINKQILTYCVDMGIMGIECYHSKHSKNDEKILVSFSERNNLIITGGSDYHGDIDILGDHVTDIDNIPAFRERV